MLAVNWDQHILHRAMSAKPHDGAGSLPHYHMGDSLEVAYSYCKNITAIHSKSFYMASSLLSPSKRRAVRALYAFCRTTDDIVDNASNAGDADLRAWRDQSLGICPRFNDPVSIAWANTRKDFRIPSCFALQLIDGVSRDMHINRYAHFDALADYCYGVASTVGLMSMHIIGYNDEKAIRYAVKLGVALQLTNILRDIAEDYSRGRIYLPQDELNHFGITDEHFSRGIVDDAWAEMMKFQIARTRSIYDESWPGIAMLNADGRMAIAAAASFYKGILSDIERRGYDVFSGRARVTKWGKIKQIPRIWYHCNLAPDLSKFSPNSL
ncbi:MAG: phytoene/squalene synthase family protein [Flavobacteriales bacterium]